MASEKPPFLAAIPSHLAHVNGIRAFLVSVCKVYSIETEVVDALALAVHEAITNIIRHSHHHHEELRVEMHIFPREDCLEIHLLDEGPTFDITQVPELDPAELRVGGRGVFLIRTILDEASTMPRPSGRGNILRLVKRCTPKAPMPSDG
ncbi:MAG: ATP-binding protein [Planctomycetia bacterium]|nr:ATP-binding protein [Planctomycetia bacterium]